MPGRPAINVGRSALKKPSCRLPGVNFSLARRSRLARPPTKPYPSLSLLGGVDVGPDRSECLLGAFFQEKWAAEMLALTNQTSNLQEVFLPGRLAFTSGRCWAARRSATRSLEKEPARTSALKRSAHAPRCLLACSAGAQALRCNVPGTPLCTPQPKERAGKKTRPGQGKARKCANNMHMLGL